MSKRIFDVVLSVVGLVVASPIMLAVALAVRLSSGGPVIYRAKRVGKDGQYFTMFKFRTMRDDGYLTTGPRITSAADPRVFAVGRVLRRLKLDEVPQLWNVVIGEMAIVGPRPEDPWIVEHHYTRAMKRTLELRPGLVSPGSLYGTMVGDTVGGSSQAESEYVDSVLPTKLALELVYLERRSFRYDLQLIGRAIALIGHALLGHGGTSVPELARAEVLMEEERILRR